MQEWMHFYKNKRILVTGHTGFKGSWMCRVLLMSGSEITGYALKPPEGHNLFRISQVEDRIRSFEGDIRDLGHLKQVFRETRPEIVIHMAAQPLVRESYNEPVGTYETNVMGTVNVLECIRLSDSVRSFINVTTDKVYKNKEWCWGYRENEELDGFDPYSNSKSCSELVTSSYKRSFFADRRIAVSTVRAGNVVGGGDFAIDRIIPDCIRAVQTDKEIIVRNPYSVRPFEHVLEPVMVYLKLARDQYMDPGKAGSYNVGPDERDCLTTGELVTLFCEKWKAVSGQQATWKNVYDGGPHEAGFLKLDCSKLKDKIGWKPRWNIIEAMEKVVEWYYIYLSGGDVAANMDRQIEEYGSL